MQSDFDKDLLTYFTDVEHLRELFKQYVASKMLAKRLLAIHGVGGVGKSSLLRMFRLNCKSVHVPVALASGDESKSVFDVLTRWAEDLKDDRIILPSFNKTFEHFRTIQAKVDERAKKTKDARGRVVDVAGKAMSKTAEAAGGALVGAVIGSIIPGIGTAIGGALGGVLGGMGAEALVDWLRGFLKQPDIDLLLDPAKKLTDNFLSDIAQMADKQRIVLMLDTFEQMTALNDWARDVAQRLHANVLFVIAGRALPNWDRTWQSWMANTQIEELKPMTEDVMRELVRRYYATMRGGEPNPAQVEQIIHFARGLPMVVASAVRLWVAYGVEDFQSVKPLIVADLVDRLMEGMPTELIPALEAAAIVRCFDQSILRAVMNQDDVREVYNELWRFPFVRTRAEGLALHDSVREIMNENLRIQDLERYTRLHHRAAAHFELQMVNSSNEDAGRLGLERLYHYICSDESKGMHIFQEVAEQLATNRLINQFRILLNDANSYSLRHENNNLWRLYYNARLAFFDLRWADAEEIYQQIDKNPKAEPRLRAYSLCDLADHLMRFDNLSLPDGVEKAQRVVDVSLELMPKSDPKFVVILGRKAGMHVQKREYDKAIDVLEKYRKAFYQQNAKTEQLALLDVLSSTYSLIGDFKKALKYYADGLTLLGDIPNNKSLRIRFIRWNQLVRSWTGQYKEAEQALKEVLDFSQETGDIIARPPILKELGLVFGLQGKYKESEKCFTEALEGYESRGIKGKPAVGIIFGFQGVIALRQGKLEMAEKYLREGLSVKREMNDVNGFSEIMNWIAEVYEIKASRSEETEASFAIAKDHYNQSLQVNNTSGRHYFRCAALVGLTRVKSIQKEYASLPLLVLEAEQLAQQYEYNDYLASLRLTQGMTTNVEQINKYDIALNYFKQAMVYALRYNRFLLDEVLSGRPQGTPVHPIIPYCLECSGEGRKMLIALHDWWKTGINDVGKPRADTISPILEGILLLEGERIAREREPGDGSPQKSVVEQIEAAL